VFFKERLLVNDDILTIDEVAQYLRVSERTVYDWAQKGEIPAGKIGTAWRFKKTELEKWVNERLASKSKSAVLESAVKVKNILSADRIVFVNCSAKRDALIELSSVLAMAPQVKDKSELTEEILKREELMSTAIGRGIAIPHVRLSSVTDLVMAVGICRADIVDFQPIDDEPVRLLIMIAAAYNQHSYYLQTLSYFSARLKNQELREALARTTTSGEAYNLLIKE
jgi:PTS system nitrogen regulatory IIA component